MAVINNTASEIGDVIEIRTSIPAIGILTLTGFTDVVVGETGSKFFIKTFRYATDGINFSEWMPLTVPNVAAIAIQPTDTLIAQYRYQRSGSDATGTLAFTEAELQGTYETVLCGDSYENSIFAQYFTCTSDGVLVWMINVLEKLYKEGQIPKYIERDGDFIEFWRSMAIFFAYLVELSRQFENFADDEELLRSFLEERGLYFCGDESLSELQDVAQNFYREIGKRGTLQITAEPTGAINGELLRLICKDPLDFFQLAYSKPQNSTFSVNNSSPLSRSTEGDDAFDLSYEPGQGFSDIAKYPVIDPGTKVTVDAPNLLLTGIVSGEDAGIGANESLKRILIDPTLNFTLSFDIEASVAGIGMLTVGFLAFDEAGSAISMRSMIDGTAQNNFIEDYAVNIANQTYRVKAVLFNKDEANNSSSLLNIGVGRNLRSISGAKYIIPYIIVNPTSGSIDVQISNLRFQVSSLSYARNYVNIKHFINIIVKNNNGNFNDAKIRTIMREELLPANANFQNTYL